MKKFLSLLLAIIFLLFACTPEAPPLQQSEKTNNEKIIGVWLNYNEIGDIVKLSNTEADFEGSVRAKIKKLKEYSVNTIFLHVRAFDDSFYRSKIFPVSKYCKGENGNLKFDVLKIFIKIGHEENVKIHAWINPYRISNNKDDLSDKENVIVCDNGIYYNPASLESQKHIIDGVKEILQNYSVDGIHFDDYFYPDASPEIDSGFYTEYVNNGGYLSLGDYRRRCVNALISGVYSAVKNYDENICFSVSPSGSIDDDINKYFADVKLWASEKGYVDYIIPQIYYGFNNQKYPFESTVCDWTEITGEDVKLLIGLPLYKTGNEDKYAGTGKSEWLSSSDVISRQISFINAQKKVIGYSFYSGGTFFSENLSEIQKTELQNIKNVIK